MGLWRGTVSVPDGIEPAPDTGALQGIGNVEGHRVGALFSANTMTEMENAYPSRRGPAHLPPVVRHNEPVVVHLTACSSGRHPRLANRDVHEALREAWTALHDWRVGDYVVMPDHVHLFCSPGAYPLPALAHWVAAWKRRVAVRLKAGRGLWQRDFWDTQMRSLADYTEKLSYVRLNPVRRGLVTDAGAWPFKGQVFEIRW